MSQKSFKPRSNVRSIVNMFPSPTSLTLAIHAELEANSTLSSLTGTEMVKQQKAGALTFFTNGMDFQESYLDPAGATIKRKVMVNWWKSMIKDMNEWEIDGQANGGAKKDVQSIT